MRYNNSGLANGSHSNVNGTEPLTDDDLMRIAPSVFATTAHESRSDRFVPIPTIDVLNGLRTEGFQPYAVAQAKTRVPGKADFTKHLIRLRHDSLANAEGEAFEIILLNANDGTAAYQMMPGFFRFLCLNGLIVGERFDDIKIRHSGNAVDNVIDAAYEVLDTAPKVIDQVASFKGTRLTDGERMAYAAAAHTMRFDDAEKAPIKPERLLDLRRRGDQGDSLWNTFNIVQENLLKGGQRGSTVDALNRHRRATTRTINGIDQNKALNRALWTLTEEMQKLAA